MAIPILVSFSGGKDCLMALARLRAASDFMPVGLLTTITRHFDRVAMHGIRRDVLEAQAAALALPLVIAELDWPSHNDAYEQAIAGALTDARKRWPTLRHVAFGDLFLADVRAWRERQMAALGFAPVFPLWGEDTTALARQFIADGHRAMLVCVDTEQLDARFCGREFDRGLLDALPAGVDPCGERGEFHTLSFAGPAFARPLALRRGESVLREQRFFYTDFLLDDTAN